MTSTILPNSAQYATFPLVPGGKLPAIVGWTSVQPGMYPAEGNYGIVLRADQLVIDGDPRSYPEGRDVLAELLAKYAPPQTRTVTTPRGGYHLYFTKPPELKFKKKQTAFPGIDFLSEGAYVVGPGSRTSDGDYVLRFDVAHAELPAALCADLETIAERVETGGDISLSHFDQFVLECQTAAPAVQGQQGDAATYALACRGRDLGLPPESIYEALRDNWNWKCQPPWSDSDLYAKVAHAYKYAKNAVGCASASAAFTPDMASPVAYTLPSAPVTAPDASKPKKKSKLDLVVDCASEAELWRDEGGNGYATIVRDGHAEHYTIIGSRTFQSWLEKRHLEVHKTIPTEAMLRDALRSIDGRARLASACFTPGLRVAKYEECVWIDLCNASWEAIRVSAEGWQIVANPPVRFVRTDDMLPLPMPVSSGLESLHELRALLGLTDREAWTLFLAFVVSSFQDGRSCPILAVSGQQGSGKSTLTRVARALTDPNRCPDRGPPKNEDDLMIAARNNHVLSFDNLSGLKSDLADALCRLATGGSLGKRKHYADLQEVTMRACRPIIVNGIGSMTGRSDFLDRALLLELPRIENGHITEEAVWRKFDQIHPRVFGALLNAVSGALRRFETVVKKLDRKLTRMADFHCWAVAAEPDLGIEPGAFEASYRANRRGAAEQSLDASPLAQFICAMKDRKEGVPQTRGRFGFVLQTQTTDWLLDESGLPSPDLPWEGSVKDLLALAKESPLGRADQSSLPKNDRLVWNHLERVAPALRQVGIEVKKLPRRSDTRCPVRITRLAPAAIEAVAAPLTIADLL